VIVVPLTNKYVRRHLYDVADSNSLGLLAVMFRVIQTVYVTKNRTRTEKTSSIRNLLPSVSCHIAWFDKPIVHSLKPMLDKKIQAKQKCLQNNT
jgi:hypothetical protein